MMNTRLMVFSQQDTFEFEISPNDIFSAVLREGINKEHSLTIVTTVRLQKGQRILFKDHMEKWREYVVYGCDERHENGERPFGEYVCVWSLQHDFELFTIDEIPGLDDPISTRDALLTILKGTNRWEVGRLTTSNLSGAEMIQVTGWEALSILVENWGGEIDADISLNDEGVISRAVSVYQRMGSQVAKRRFDYSSDLISIHRKVEEMPLACRIRPLGKTEKDVDGFDVHVTIEEANDGVDYLQNDSMADILKLPYTRRDGSVGYEYPIVNVENTDIDDPEELLEWGLSVLEEHTTPKVTYSSDVMQLSAAGMDVYGVALGDMVQCVDRGFSDDGVRISVRVVFIEQDLMDESNTKLTMGDVTESYVLSVSKAVHQVQRFTFGARTTAQYLDSLLTQLNGQINATGGYTYIVPGHGMITYDKAVSDPTKGEEATAVVEIKGGSIRIGNRPNTQSEWEYRTVFVSGHIAADLVTAAQITSGYIRSANGNVYIDLDNGTFRFAGIERNLLRNSDFGYGINHWHGISASLSSEADEDFGTRLKAVTTDAGGYDCRVYTDRETNFEHEAGTTYSVSLWAKADSANTISVNCGGYDVEGQSYVYHESVGTEWQRYTGTITAEGAYALSILLGSAGTLYVAEVMLVRGDVYQEWEPGLIDAVDARSVATNYLGFSTSRGLDIGYTGTQSKVNVSGGGVSMYDREGVRALQIGIQYTSSGSIEPIIRIGRSDDNHIDITNASMIFRDSSNVALMSLLQSSIRVGKESDINVLIGNEGYMDVLKNGDYLAHIGYGYGTNSDKVYYTFGSRKNFETGMHSFCAGQSNAARGSYAFAAGYGNEASASYAVTIGRNNVADYTTSSSPTLVLLGLNNHTVGTNGYLLGEGLVNYVSEVAVGTWNTAPAATTELTRIFTVGCGRSSSSRKDGLTLDYSGNLWIAGSLTQNSDRRLKKHLAYLGGDACEFIRALKPALFIKDGERQVGFYAQDVMEAEPEGWDTTTVSEQHTDESLGFDPLTLDYQAIIAPLVSYTQALERRIIELEKRLDALEGRA